VAQDTGCYLMLSRSVAVPVANPRRAMMVGKVLAAAEAVANVKAEHALKLCVLRIVGLRVCWLERRLISEFPLRQPLKLTRSKLHVSR
jgi:hypothetical protein